MARDMKIVQRNVTINTPGYIDRLEHGPVVRRDRTHYLHVKESIIVQRPKIEDLNALVVVHDQVEVYV